MCFLALFAVVDDDANLRFFQMNSAAKLLLPNLTSGVAYGALSPSFAAKLGVGRRHGAALAATSGPTRVVQVGARTSEHSAQRFTRAHSCSTRASRSFECEWMTARRTTTGRRRRPRRRRSRRRSELHELGERGHCFELLRRALCVGDDARRHVGHARHVHLRCGEMNRASNDNNNSRTP